MHRECRERFPRHRGLAIPTCITARAWPTQTGGFLWSRWRGKRSWHSRHSRRMRNPPFYVSGKRLSGTIIKQPCRLWLNISHASIADLCCHHNKINHNKPVCIIYWIYRMPRKKCSNVSRIVALDAIQYQMSVHHSRWYYITPSALISCNQMTIWVGGTTMRPWFRSTMMTSSNGNIFRVTGHLCGEFTGPRWIPRTKASDAELWCFLWSARE